MKTFVLVDVGNTRIKWGWATSEGLQAAAALSADDPASWQELLDCWKLDIALQFFIAGVHPQRCRTLAEWARGQGHEVTLLDDWRKLPLSIQLDHPDRAGIDRLLSAVAANHRRLPDTPAIVVNAGTAVTVDWLDADGAFSGGAILPGLHLMARAMHEHTALLPLVDVPQSLPALPGTSTAAAMQAGVFWAVAGGVRALIDQLSRQSARSPQIFVTGGDAPLLMQGLANVAFGQAPVHWPWMTLEGIRLTAEKLL